jgi:hypothetical protein
MECVWLGLIGRDPGVVVVEVEFGVSECFRVEPLE